MLGFDDFGVLVFLHHVVAVQCQGGVCSRHVPVYGRPPVPKHAVAEPLLRGTAAGQFAGHCKV